MWGVATIATYVACANGGLPAWDATSLWASCLRARATCSRMPTLRDASVASDYVASIGDMYAGQVTAPWSDVIAAVEARVRDLIAREGSFTVRGDTGAFVCR